MLPKQIHGPPLNSIPFSFPFPPCHSFLFLVPRVLFTTTERGRRSTARYPESPSLSDYQLLPALPSKINGPASFLGVMGQSGGANTALFGSGLCVRSFVEFNP